MDPESSTSPSSSQVTADQNDVGPGQSPYPSYPRTLPLRPSLSGISMLAGTNVQVASETEPPTEPETSAEKEEPNPLDAAIERILRTRPDPHKRFRFCMHEDEQRVMLDLDRLENLETQYCSGDTMVVIEFPEPQMDRVDCNGLPWRAQTFWVHSQHLLETGSSVFKHLFSAPKQARVKRRFGMSDCQYFILDLTPPAEGDELASQLAELSLPACVRDWWLSKTRFYNKSALVSGHDDSCPHHSAVLDNPEPRKGVVFASSDASRVFRPAAAFDLRGAFPVSTRDIPDYCPIRHRANIIRLILAIMERNDKATGQWRQDLVLNSAPRMYTIVELAKVFDCVSVVRDSVFSWLMDSPNTEFMDLCPEVALHVAWNVKIPDVTRATLRILIIEHTLDSLANPERQPKDNGVTLFGRPREFISDELQNIIQHSTLKFSERVQYTLDELQGPMALDWLLGQGIHASDLGEIGRLRRIPVLFTTLVSGQSVSVPDTESSLPPPVQKLENQCALILEGLLHFVQNAVEDALRRPPLGRASIQWQCDESCYVDSQRSQSLQKIYRKMNPVQRLLTRHFWVEMASSMSDEAIFNSFPLECGNRPSTLGTEIDRFNSFISDAYATYTLRGQPFWDINSPQDIVGIKASDLLRQITEAADDLKRKWVYDGVYDDNSSDNRVEVPLLRSTHLALNALASEEFKYLPLWADGNDDGTGGVFDELAVPDTDMGPVGPGPAYHTGQTMLSEDSSFCPSEDTATVSDDSGKTMTMTQGRSLAVAGSGTGRDSVIMISGSVPASSFGPSSVATPRTEGGDDDGDDMVMATSAGQVPVMAAGNDRGHTSQAEWVGGVAAPSISSLSTPFTSKWPTGESAELESAGIDEDENMDWFNDSDDDDVLHDIDEDDNDDDHDVAWSTFDD